jgi:hypothetical protein
MPPADREALVGAARDDRQAREACETARYHLEDAIRVAVANGASLRAVAELVDLSHGRVRDIVKRMPLQADDYYEIVNGDAPDQGGHIP